MELINMGSSNSRPKICRVKPSQNWFEEQPFSETTSNRMTTAVQNTTEDHHEILRRQPFNQLPSLKQQVPHIVDSRPVFQKLNNIQDQSIIRSHPPQRAKAWQPTAPTMDPTLASGTNGSMADGWRDSAPNQRGRCKPGTKQQRNMDRFLQAQTSLACQANKKLRAHQKHFREKRREQKQIFTFTDGDNQRTERIRLVSRPTQRDIFWDETKEQWLDLRELLQPTPELTDSDSEQEENPKGLLPNKEASVTSNRFSRNMNQSVKCDRGHSKPVKPPNQIARQKIIPWLEDFRSHEKKTSKFLEHTFLQC